MGPVPFFILVFGILLFSISEYIYIIKKANYTTHTLLLYVFSSLIFISAYINTTKIASTFLNQATSIIITLTLLSFFIVEIIRQKINKSIERIAVGYLGAFILAWCFSHLLLLRDIKPYGVFYTLYLFVLIWFADTSAYLFGTHFGKRSLARKISPKKTVEGLIGAFISSIFISTAFDFFIFKTKAIQKVIMLGLLLVAIAQISDLSESLIKREAGIKDTDNLLPGHGGMLDRFDSFLFSTPFFYYYLILFSL